ncbi:hypothetical protein KR038_001362 [Drosophila bunnanda]|nr:hypothetical protein KR038_001362 [Drosophila bunnanda]
MPVVDLRVDRNLVCNNFKGYKLSFDPVPILREDLLGLPSTVNLLRNDFSHLHFELFARQNLLCADPWIPHNTYFMNSDHQVMQCIYDPQIGRSLGLRVAYNIENYDHGDGYEVQPGDYNYSMCFISERFCVICDGITTLHLLDTGDRSRPVAEEWKLVTRAPVDRESGKRGYIMYNARLDVVQERKQISVAAGRISRREEGAAQAAQVGMHYTEIVWGHWIFNIFSNEWEYTIRERLETAGTLQYCAFEPRAESLIIGSNRKVETRRQREAAEAAAVAAAAAPPTAPPEEAQNGHEVTVSQDAEDAGREETYSWVQTNNDVIIHFPLPESATREDITVRLTSTTLEVIYLEQVLLAGALYRPVHTESMVWLVEGSALHLTLAKHTQHLRWPHVLQREDADADANAVDERAGPSNAAALPIPNLEDPIEECDLGTLDDENQIVRFNLPKNEITHTIFLGSHPLLFVTDLRPGFPPAFATREGVDASLWLQVYQPSRPDEWDVRHVGQIHALGYVQASKLNRKFTACCAEFKYSVICETRRNVLIYHSRHESAEGLRKRNGRPVVIGKQSVINIEFEHGEIMGVAAASNVITILTEYALMHLQL